MTVHITYFVHGTTTDNEQGLATGWSPGALSPPGIRQARGSSATETFDAVFCSDLKRAVDSAAPAFGDRHTITKDERLRECNYGDFTGKPAQQFKGNMQAFAETPFPNGESFRDVEKRIAAFLAFLKKKYNGKHVALVAHQSPQLALDVLLKGRTWQQAIGEDWRRRNAWQPGWHYVLK